MSFCIDKPKFLILDQMSYTELVGEDEEEYCGGDGNYGVW